MLLKPIKNAAAYRVVLPAAALLEDHLATRPFTEPRPTDQSSLGFVPTPTVSEGELVTTFIGGYAFSVRYDDKVIPGGVVLVEIAKACEEFTARTGLKASRSARKEIKEDVIAQLRARALVRTKIITCFYHPELEILVVPVSSQNLADQITKLLIQAVESIESRTIHISELAQGLTTRLAGKVAGEEDTFAPFEISSSVWLIGPSGEKVTYQMGETLDGANDGLQELLDAGFFVDAVRLHYQDVEFKLTRQFKFRSVDFPAPAEVQDTETQGDMWRHEASVQLLSFVTVVKTLCDLFGYKAPAAEEQTVEDPMS